MSLSEASNGDILFCGNDRSLGFANFRPFVARISSSGALIWANGYNFPGAGNFLIRGKCLEASDSGNIYFTGQTSTPELIFAGLSSAGTLLVAQTITGTGVVVGRDIAAHPNGNLLLLGLTNAPSQGGFDLLFVEL